MERTFVRSRFDELDLGVICVEPQGETRAVLQLVHGMAEHKERYLPLMEYLAQKGVASVIHDHRGHGESVKGLDSLGYMFDGGWEALVDDVHTVQEWAKAKFPGKPFYLMGHSMGSMVVRSFTKRYDSSISGLIVCDCPSDNMAKGLGKLMACCEEAICGGKHPSKLLNSIAFGSYDKPFKGEGRNAWLSASKENVKAYNADPLCGFCFTANGFRNLFSLMQDCYSPKGWAMSNPSLPIHFISGGDDPCRISDKDFHKAVDFLKARGYTNVTPKLYPGLRHEILNEDCKEDVFDDVCTCTGSL